MGASKNPIANQVVVLREEFDDWAVLFNPDTAEAMGINPIGVSIWKLMDGSRDLDSIVREIADQYEDVPGTASEEIREFVDTLSEKGFVGYEEKSDD